MNEREREKRGTGCLRLSEPKSKWERESVKEEEGGGEGCERKSECFRFFATYMFIVLAFANNGAKSNTRIEKDV